ncbi:MAG: type II toxin-antitoxin system VapC family toxin [Terracidiphilus sp.]|nr:type II toxin-antitoxin system VapC family toxin [Terracidiphilus sp.]
MTGLDTNILVRFFAKDDPQQSPKAKAVLTSLTNKEPGWIGIATILELVWVMESKFRMGRPAISGMLSQLLGRDEIVIEKDSVLQNAVQLFRSGNADFADCLIASSAKAAGCLRTVTFDRIAARDAGMELIG